MTRVYGIDFSGARYAGRSIWIAEGAVSGPKLDVVECFQARDQFGSRRDPCLAGLGAWLAGLEGAVVGIDFPFGLPAELCEGFGWSEWEQGVRGFGARFPTPEAFKEACFRQLGREAKRDTDLAAKTPFSPYNLRIYRQTYYGIRDVLAPLVESGKAVVLPMQRSRASALRVIEICPASTLKTLVAKVPSYKDRGDGDARRLLLDVLEQNGVSTAPPVRDRVLDDWRGDALDCVVAAFAARRALLGGFKSDGPAAALEGFVFV